MRREPSLTFEGALRILGHHEPRLIERLNTVLGGVILAAGAAAGLAAVGPPALAPGAMFAAIWGFTDQKSEAISLLRKAVGSVSGKLAGTGGYERRQLIAAAHTTIVVAAFFESFREHVGREFFDRLEITQNEKQRLVTGLSREPKAKIYDHLYAAEVPTPSPANGFMENVASIGDWMARFADDFDGFLHGLRAAENTRFDWTHIRDGALERYQSHFLSLAAKVPEFMIWALLGEGAATRATVAELRADIAAALDARRDALGRVESLLALDAAREAVMYEVRASVARANGGILEQPIIPEDARGYGTDITFPKVGEIYVNPRYRLAPPGETARPADDRWWEDQPSRDDFDLMLAGYVTSPDAARLPMLLLGHPGAGKSMLTKVFASRLPTSAYTVIRVPLRRVGANVPPLSQIEQALGLATNGRVTSWWQLAEESRDTVRVVLLDGLDELLQATRNDRSGYLQEVMEFQRLEAEQERPVVVVVTSRTVVADRVDVPRGTSIVKLDAFDDSDIGEWLARWRAVNAEAIATGKLRELAVDAVTGEAETGDAAAGLARPQDAERPGGRMRELARQPLLLLMLALYAADPALPALDADLATADLYQQLLESFARRESRKDIGHDLHGDELEPRVQDHLDRLAIAALAMFNRGRQDIGEEELGTDLAALDPNPRPTERFRPVEEGQRVIGEFFFVHAAEARPRTGPDEAARSRAGASPHREPPRRSYEFLHATFGEYLVASRVMSELADMAAKAFAGRRSADPDDDLLHALLSHQPLSARKSTLTFAREIFAGLPDRARGHVLEVLETLLGTYRYRHRSDRYAAYRPMQPDRVRELACYSANLVALRATLGNGVSLHDLLGIRNDDDALQPWRSTVMLWKAGLDADGLQSMLATVELSQPSLSISANPKPAAEVFGHEKGRPAGADEISLARLMNERILEQRLRYGFAMVDDYLYSYDSDDAWMHQLASWLIPAVAGKGTSSIFPDPPEDVSAEDVTIVAGLIFRYFRSAYAEPSRDEELLRLLSKLPVIFEFDQPTLAGLALSGIRELVTALPELGNSKAYGPYNEIIRRARLTEPSPIPEDNKLEAFFKNLSDEAVAAIGLILKIWTRGKITAGYPRGS